MHAVAAVRMSLEDVKQTTLAYLTGHAVITTAAWQRSILTTVSTAGEVLWSNSLLGPSVIQKYCRSVAGGTIQERQTYN